MNKIRTIVFDIESGPAPDDELLRVQPSFKAPSNYKSADAISKYCAEAKEEWKDGAAKNAITGRILCIGLMDDGEFSFIEGEEKSIILQFYSLLCHAKFEVDRPLQIVGYNSATFDIPYIIRRGWLLGIQPPVWFRSGRYWNERFVDLREVWQCGDRQASTGGLDGLAKAFGLPGKTGSGKDFHKLWASDKPKAIEYLQRDLWLTQEVGIRMGVIASGDAAKAADPFNPCAGIGDLIAETNDTILF